MNRLQCRGLLVFCLLGIDGFMPESRQTRTSSAS
jgi:hypothetical protein